MRATTLLALFLFVLPACGGDSAGPDGSIDFGPGHDGGPGTDFGPDHDGGPRPDGGFDAGTTIDAGPDVPPLGTLSADVRVDHIGWRTADTKVAVLLGHAGAMVQVVNAHDGTVAGTYTPSGTSTDEDSGDAAATVDFSPVTTPGDYYVYLPTESLRSYRFTIGDTAFDLAARAAVKSYYFQRCNSDRVLPFATDAIAGAAGIGGQWLDTSCHGGDTTAPAQTGGGLADDGALDLHGGWHDAGDYQKTLWSRGVPEMLFAYEMNASAWTDGELNLPESGNGVPDILDEVAWELDFYVRMQRPDGHFLTSVKGNTDTATSSSPPSSADEDRVYFDGTAYTGSGWSGGGVTTFAGTANATMSLAHAAVVFAGIDDTRAASYRAAATSGWTWLAAHTAGGGNEDVLKAVAASAVHRMDGSIGSATTAVTGFSWSTWNGGRGGGATPSDGLLATGIWHYLASSGRDGGVETGMRDAVGDVIVGGAFSEAGVYGGMFGGPGNGWEWSWGSNRSQSFYGAELMMAAHYGILGGHTEAEVTELAERHLHFMLGLNSLNMLYLTNMAAYGGEHSSFQIYHGWFSYTGSDGDHGNAMYNGKPTSVDEPLYPYYPDDSATSMYGPAPGIVPGGPNAYYSGGYTIPDLAHPANAYRDFSVGCDWNGSACAASGWEITEPDVNYQGAFVMMVGFFKSR